MRRARLAVATVAALLACSVPALADPAVLYPTVLEVRTQEGVVLRRAGADDRREAVRVSHELDQVLTEAAQDLGLTLDLSERRATQPAQLEEAALVARAGEGWVISPRLALDGSTLRVRIVAVPPRSRVLMVRSQSVERGEVAVRAMVMLRDLVEAGHPEPEESETPEAATLRSEPRAARSQGRAVLALNAAAFGGFVGYSIQVAAGSSDARLTYPLIALGTGIGLGGSMIVADEWDVGLGDAYYLSAGAWWPLASGLFLASGYQVDTGDRYAYGLAGAATGVTLATVSLGFKGMGDGGAALTHSGGAFGLLIGGLSEWAVEGSLEDRPNRGMGFGAGIGVLGAGIIATQIDVAPSRVLMIDLGAMLGALTGAAAASPLAFGESESETKNRLFVASTAAGLLGGGAIAFISTRPSGSADSEPSSYGRRPRVLPWAGPLHVETGGPAWGLGAVGSF